MSLPICEGLVSQDERRERVMCSILSFLNAPNAWCQVYCACETWRATEGQTRCPTGFADWYYPFNTAVDYTSLTCGTGIEGKLQVDFYRQDSNGYLQKVKVEVEKSCGSAEVVHVEFDLQDVNPGFMAKLPMFVTVTLDWLYFGWKKSGINGETPPRKINLLVDRLGNGEEGLMDALRAEIRTSGRVETIGRRGRDFRQVRNEVPLAAAAPVPELAVDNASSSSDDGNSTCVLAARLSPGGRVHVGASARVIGESVSGWNVGRGRRSPSTSDWESSQRSWRRNSGKTGSISTRNRSRSRDSAPESFTSGGSDHGSLELFEDDVLVGGSIAGSVVAEEVLSGNQAVDLGRNGG